MRGERISWISGGTVCNFWKMFLPCAGRQKFIYTIREKDQNMSKKIVVGETGWDNRQLKKGWSLSSVCYNILIKRCKIE